MMTIHLHPPKPTGPRLPPAARYACAAIAFLVPSVWLLMLLACVKFGDDWPAACEPVNYPAAALAIGLLVFGSLGLTYLERARRRARKGMWQKVAGPGAGWGKLFERTVRVVWGSEEESPGLIAGEMRYQRRGWYIDVKSGRRVWVDRRQLWEWLYQVEALVAAQEPGPISERRWQPIIGRDLWLAYMEILEAVGAVEYPTDDVRSRRYRPGGAWSRVEEFEKLRPSESY